MPLDQSSEAITETSPLLATWRSGFATFPGLMQFDLPESDEARDRYIFQTIHRIKNGLERDVSDQLRWVWRDSGDERRQQRDLVVRLVRRLRVARRLYHDAFRQSCATRPQRERETERQAAGLTVPVLAGGV